MMKIVLAILTGILMLSGSSVDDPYVASESPLGGGLWHDNHGYTDTTGRTLRSPVINTAVKNLVLIVAGQSLTGAHAPTAFSPVNSTVVDNLNIYDGSIYQYADPPLGASWVYLALGGALPTPNPGSIGGRIADSLVTAGKFARVIVVPVGIGGTTITQWSSTLYTRIGVAMRRLAAKGITPQTTNVTFATLWMQGQGDSGTSTGVYTAGLNSIQASAVAAGFSGRFFVSRDTWLSGVVNANVQAAQTGIVDGVKFWAGGDMDSLNASNRQGDNTHFNDTGIAAAAALQVSAMGASGAPF